MTKLNNYTDKDFEALLNDAFAAEPAFDLSDNFADNLTTLLKQKNYLRQYLLDFLIYVLMFIGLGAITFGIFYYQNSEVVVTLKNFVQVNYVWLLGINLVLLFVLFTDRVLLRYFHYRLNTKR